MRRALAAAAMAVALGCGGAAYHGEGDVVGVDAAANRITINHEDIPGLMPAMTMTFPARSTGVLADVAPGSRVRFDVVKDGDLLVVTASSGMRTVQTSPAGVMPPVKSWMREPGPGSKRSIHTNPNVP